MRRRTVLIGSVAVAAALVAISGVTVASGATPAVRTQVLRVPVGAEPSGTPVSLDATLYTPDVTGPVPAVLLAHGFGGSKDDLDAQAQDLARNGYVVLAYTARGFGASDGNIHLDSPAYEVADGQRMLDLLATRPEVRKDAVGDPRVGVAGGSYGGGLTLLLAAADRRVDAIAPEITWSDLRQALFPQFVVADNATASRPSTPAAIPGGGTPGVFKKLWAGVFFSPGGAGLPADGGTATATGTPAAPSSTPTGAAPSGTAPTGTAPAGATSPGPTPIGTAPAGTAPAGSRATDGAGAGAAAAGQVPARASAGEVQCGRFAPDLCSAYQQVASSGRPTQRILDLLWQSSPARVLDRIKAPTLLVQGEADSLFPLSEGDANAHGIAANGTPVKVVWEGGGHDGGIDESDRLRSLTRAWFDHYLKGSGADGSGPGGASAGSSGTGSGSAADTRFEITVPSAALSSQDTRPAPQIRVADGEPGVTASGPVTTDSFKLLGRSQLISAPPGGSPAAITSLPGIGSALSALAGAGSAGAPGLSSLPGQVARFTTAPLAAPLEIVGAPRVSVHVTSSTSDATLFARLYDIAPDGSSTLPESLVSPLYLSGLTPAGRDVTISLPAVVREVATGHRLGLELSTTDQAYALPADPRTYRISLAGDATVTVPEVDTTPLVGSGLWGLLPWAGGLVVVVLLGTVVAVLAGRRGRAGASDPGLETVPLAIRGLGKVYGDGFRAVSDLGFEVRPGWVLGLLGPNGAGKTTTLRMAMGLIRPTEGEIRVFGQRVTPGAAVLSRVGSFVEGPGFLPHVSGLENLRLFWAATGRPEAQAHLAEALEVAGLGDDVHRKVRTYSQGMRQRLAIAQAMLGLPDLLLLDEPTNGLDPPQIREMRDVLARYAASGRTVVVSSHLLAEVEQTCSHVVVMHGGRLVAQGPVADLVGAATTLVVDVDDPDRAAEVAAGIPGAKEIETTPSGLVLQLVGTPRARLVRALVEAGLEVERVAPRHGLEEAFLTLVGQGDRAGRGEGE